MLACSFNFHKREVFDMSESELRSKNHAREAEKGKLELKKKVRQLKDEKSGLKRELRIAGEKIAKLEELVERDPLTGLRNRRGFDSFFGREISRLSVPNDCRKFTSKSLGVLSLDLDLFKRVNDQYGHQVGDVALVSFAQILERFVRKYDAVCRMGGEEFVVILPGVGEEELKRLGEKIRSAQAAVVFDQCGLRITVSIGGAVQYDQAGQDLLKKSDLALYKAKKNGRNQVVIADRV
jgi:diguanylate cyclase (GGDEF)-like protein